jgi:ATP-dependent DNA helicase DinG
MGYHATHPLWEGEILPNAKVLIEETARYVQTLRSLEEDLNRIKNDKLTEQLKGPLHEVRALAVRLSDACTLLERFIDPHVPPDKVRWIEVQALRVGFNTHLLNADLDISEPLAEALFKKFSATLVVSATLTTNKQFDFLRSRLGILPEKLEGKGVTESIYEAPFNYREQALLLIPTDMPAPADPTFISEAAERIEQALDASRGNAFVLFTSYSMLKAAEAEALQCA